MAGTAKVPAMFCIWTRKGKIDVILAALMIAASTVGPTDLMKIENILVNGNQKWAQHDTMTFTLGDAPERTSPTDDRLLDDRMYGESDHLTINGSVDISPGFDLHLYNLNPIPTDHGNAIYEWIIADVTGNIKGFNNVSIQSPGWSLFEVDTPNHHGDQNRYIGVRYEYTAVPEAGTLALGVVGSSVLLLHRKRAKC
jgi:hypothetical protein